MTNMSQHIKPLSFDAWYSLNERIFEDRYDTYVKSCDKAFEDELNKWKF